VVEGIPDSELEFQEALIEEREVEIRGIETGIHELHEIFRDLGTIVSEQQSMLGAYSTGVPPLLAHMACRQHRI
jgi:syntaxin 7